MLEEFKLNIGNNLLVHYHFSKIDLFDQYSGAASRNFIVNSNHYM